VTTHADEVTAAGRTEPRHRWWEGATGYRYLVVALFGIAAALRIWNLYRQAFWVDEYDELVISSHGIGSIVTIDDGFPPLSSLINHVWLWFGSFESVRWLAVLYGLGAVLLIWLAAQRIGGRRAGLIGLAIGAASPLLIWHSQELRTYSLVMMLAAAGLLTLLRAAESGRRADWMLYGLVSALGLWSHYFYALTVGAAIIWLWSRRRTLGPIRPVIEAHVLIFVLCLPLLALVPGDLFYQSTFQSGLATAEQSSFGVGALGYTVFSFFSGFSLGPSPRALHDASLGAALRTGWPWMLVFAILVVPLTVWTVRRWRRDDRIRLLAFLVLIPVVTAGLLSVVADVGFRPRYVSWCVVPLIVLAAVAAPRLDRVKLTVVLVLVLGASGWAYANRNYNAEYRTEDMRTAAATADQLDPSGTVPMYVSVDYMAPLAAYYTHTARPVVAVPPVRSSEESLEAAVAVIAAEPAEGPFFLAYVRPFHGDTEGRLLGYLGAHDELTVARDLAGVTLYRGESLGDG
jgi:hypothetical protein